MRKLLSISMLLFLSVLLFADGVMPVGFGTEANPYQIATLDNLLWLSTTPDIWDDNAFFLQTADIDASDTQNWNGGAGFDPIGSDWDYGFSGSYNGDNHTISDLFINRPEEELIGLFGIIYYGAEVNNLGVVDAVITGNTYNGGLVGYNDGTITNCYSTGNISGNNWTGGLVGSNGGTINNSYSTGSVTGSSGTGGLVGYNYEGTITNCYSTGSVTGSSGTGGLVGINYGTVINSYYNYESVLINNNHIITTGALNNELFNTWLPSKNLNINDYLTLDDSDYLINNVNELKYLLAFGQFPEYSYRLTSNLDLAAEDNFYIPYFSGTFNGNGEIISNLTLNMPGFYNIGMFGYSAEANINDLGIINCYVTGSNCTGGLVGLSSGTITNCYSTGSVTGEDWYTGGLVGVNRGTISNCYNTGSVTGSGETGGLVGHNDVGIITNSYSTGSVIGTWGTGGLVGNNNGYITNSYSRGDIIGDDYTGGLVGLNNGNGTISYSYSTGSVTGSSRTGGLAGGNNEIIGSCYWNIETSGQTASDGGEGRTTDEMTYPYAENTYVGWDFTEIWQADENYEFNNGYPYLRDNPPTVDIDEDELITQHSALKISNYPNPFNPTTTIYFTTTKSTENTKIEIFNIKGQKVKELLNEVLPAGEHSVVWNGKDDSERSVASGVYFTRLSANGKIFTIKMMMIK